MKKILTILLSLVLCMGLMSAAFGCGGGQEAPISPPTHSGEDPDLGDDQIQDFKNAWDAFNYAKDRFENVEEDYVTYMIGTSTNNMAKGSQNQYNERYKSSKTNNFYFNTNCYGETIFGNDPCMAFKVYKLNNSTSYQAHIEHGNFEKNSHGAQPKMEGDEIVALVADFTGVDYGDPLNSANMVSTYGIDPTKLSVYVIDESTKEDISVRDFHKSHDGSYKFTFDFNKESVHKNYKTQVKAFSQRDYKGWISTSATFTLDKFGRIKKLESISKYKIDTGFFGLTAEVTAETEEDFYYGYTSDIQMVNGNIVAILEYLETKKN